MTSHKCQSILLKVFLEFKNIMPLTRAIWAAAKTASVEASSVESAVTYPEGCSDVHEGMSVDELIRRLKALASAFQGLSQPKEADDFQALIPLCFHLVEKGFLEHPSKDVRLLVGCCLVDILRIFAPEAPYKDPDQVEAVFMFLMSQLEGLKNPFDVAFKRYLYILENLAYVRAFNMCLELDNANDIICSIFELMFSIVNESHSETVQGFMLDIMWPLLTESDAVSFELLNVILINLVEPNKSIRKSAHHLAKKLVIKCSEKLIPYMQNFFDKVFTSGDEELQSLVIRHKAYDLLYELNGICPAILPALVPNLERKMRSLDKDDRLDVVSMLGRMFAKKDSDLAILHVSLWKAFLSRFGDDALLIRKKCTQYAMHLLINHAGLREDVIEALIMRQYDAVEVVRLELVNAIVATANLDFGIVSGSEDLLNCIMELTQDTKFKIRRAALEGLAQIYKKFEEMGNVAVSMGKAVCWMKNRILHGYFNSLLDDKVLVERLLKLYLVPCYLEPRERMMKLLYLYSTTDSKAALAFIEIMNNLVLVRRQMSEFVSTIKTPDTDADYAKNLESRISSLVKLLPEPVKSSEFINKFSEDLKADSDLLITMDNIIDPETDCKTFGESVKKCLRKLGQPVMVNVYYRTIKILLERASALIIDKEAITQLVTIVKDVVEGYSDFFGRFKIDKDDGVIEKCINLVSVLASVFPNLFADEAVLLILIQLLSNGHLSSQNVSGILSTLISIGKHCAVGQQHPSILKLLIAECKNLLVSGTPRQGKLAVYCLHFNINAEQTMLQTFDEVVQALWTNLDASNPNFCTAIVALGHIAWIMPQEFHLGMKEIMSRKIVKELLVNPPRTNCISNHLKKPDDSDWCTEDELPEITKCMVHGMKAMVRWLMGLKTDLKSAANTFRLLTAFVETGGTFIKTTVPFSNAEQAWLRLVAGCSMLKICQMKGIGDQFTASQFFSLSKLMNDEVFQVRSQFAAKLHKGLNHGIPHTCLPLDFMGFYALAGYETDFDLRDLTRTCMLKDISHRLEYIETLPLDPPGKITEQLPYILPNYMLAFAIAVLTRNPKFTRHLDMDQLTEIKNCLWIILEPLIVKNDWYSVQFYTELIERIRLHKNAVEPDNEQVNCRMYIICEMAKAFILLPSYIQKTNNYISEPRIPSMYFKRHEDPYWVNHKRYLPAELRRDIEKQMEAVELALAEERISGMAGPVAKKRKKNEIQVSNVQGNVSN